MSTCTLKWIERSKLFNQSSSSNFPFCTGYKFRKTGYLLTENDKIVLGENKENLQGLKINNIYMGKKDGRGLCTICSNKNCKGRKINYTEFYAYTTYLKGLKPLPVSLQKTFLTSSNN
jgi:hypothetical protein